MTPDDLDDVLRRSLGAGGAVPPSSAGGDLDALVARGHLRRRRRQTGLAGAAAAVVLVGGLTLAARRDPSGPVAVDRTTSTIAPTAPTVAPETSTTTASAGRAPIEMVAQTGTTLAVVRGTDQRAAVETVDACAGVEETPCDVPVVAVAADDLWFLRRTASRRDVVHHHDGVSEVVFGGAFDFSVGPLDPGSGGRLLYVLRADGTLVQVDLSLLNAAVIAVLPQVAAGVREVVATTDGRLAWVTDAGVGVRSTDGTTHVIPFDAPPSQLSFAPAGPLLLVRTADGRRAVVDTATDAVATTFDATAACWGATDAIVYAYDGAADRAGRLSAVRPLAGGTVRFDDEFATDRIACTPTGAVAYVDAAGVLVRTVPGTGQATYIAGSFDRVRSVH